MPGWWFTFQLPHRIALISSKSILIISLHSREKAVTASDILFLYPSMDPPLHCWAAPTRKRRHSASPRSGKAPEQKQRLREEAGADTPSLELHTDHKRRHRQHTCTTRSVPQGSSSIHHIISSGEAGTSWNLGLGKGSLVDFRRKCCPSPPLFLGRDQYFRYGFITRLLCLATKFFRVRL